MLSVIGWIVQDDGNLRLISNRLILIFPRDEWREPVQGLVAARNNKEFLGIASTIGLFWFGAAFIAKLARAFNRLYGVPLRPALQRRLLTVVMIALFAVLLVVTFTASTVATLFVANLRQFLFVMGVPPLSFGAAERLVTFGTALFTAFVLFLALYWIIPNARQGFCDIWRGTAFAATLLVAATQIFPLYIRFAPGNRYGQFFSLIFLLTTWLYLLAHIILLGAAINAFRWRDRRAREGEPESCPVDALVDGLVDDAQRHGRRGWRRFAPESLQRKRKGN